MGLDIRFPIGMMFTLIGLLLFGTGLFTDATAALRITPTINVNLIWGACLFLFGALMWGSAILGKNK